MANETRGSAQLKLEAVIGFNGEFFHKLISLLKAKLARSGGPQM